MKNKFRALFGFILNPLESGDEEFQINPLARKILLTVSVLFIGLASAVLITFIKSTSNDYAYLLPCVIFLLVGLYGLIVGLLANDRGIAKIWGGR